MRIRSYEAYDDGYFPHYYKGGRGSTYIVGIQTEGSSRVLGVAWCTVRVDMNTSENAILSISKLFSGDVIILDGITYAGFDVVDPDVLLERSGKSVLATIQFPLNLERIEKALKKHFSDWKERFSIVKRVYENSMYVETPWRTVRVYSAGLKPEEARNTLLSLCIYSPVPEPLRIADKIASALSRLGMTHRP